MTTGSKFKNAWSRTSGPPYEPSWSAEGQLYILPFLYHVPNSLFTYLHRFHLICLLYFGVVFSLIFFLVMYCAFRFTGEAPGDGIRSSSTLPITQPPSAPPTPTHLAGTGSSYESEDRGDLIHFYNTIYVLRVKGFALKFSGNGGQVRIYKVTHFEGL